MINYVMGIMSLKPLFMLFSLQGFSLFTAPINDPKVQIIGHPVIVIDPGHGGHDKGAKGKFTLEKDLNLAVARRLKAMLYYAIPQATVLLTREEDQYISLSERSDLANKQKADIFISLHCNSNTSGKVRGLETYIMGIGKSSENLQITARENGVTMDHKSLKNYSEELSDFILLNQLQDQNMEDCLELANLCHNGIKPFHPGGSRDIRQAGFLVLWKTTMPSVLVEMGYINNTKDEAFLASEEGQIQICSGLTQAIGSFLTNKSREFASSTITPAWK